MSASMLSADQVAALQTRIGLMGFTELGASIDALVAQDGRWRARDERWRALVEELLDVALPYLPLWDALTPADNAEGEIARRWVQAIRQAQAALDGAPDTKNAPSAETEGA